MVNKTAKLKNMYDSKNKSFTRLSLLDNKYGFSGYYVNKDLGVVEIHTIQDCRDNYYLMLDIIVNSIEYHRQFECSKLPTWRLAGLKAKEFLEHIKNKNGTRTKINR